METHLNRFDGIGDAIINTFSGKHRDLDQGFVKGGIHHIRACRLWIATEVHKS